MAAVHTNTRLRREARGDALVRVREAVQDDGVRARDAVPREDLCQLKRAEEGGGG